MDASGEFMWAMEHTGDLVHRAAFAPDLEPYGVGAVWEKVEKLLRWRAWARKLPRDAVRSQAERNHEYVCAQGRETRCLSDYLQAMDDAGVRYAVTYVQLGRAPAASPCSHRLAQTWLQRQSLVAAVALGCQRWQRYDLVLNNIHEALVSAEKAGTLARLYAGEIP